MNSIKKLFQIPRPPIHLRGWRFWLPWSICFLVNVLTLTYLGLNSSSLWRWVPAGLLVWLFLALLKHEIFALPVSKIVLAVTGASHILNLLLLSILYVLILCPLGLFMRRNKKSPLQLRIDRNLHSYRIPSDPLDPQHFERPF